MAKQRQVSALTAQAVVCSRGKTIVLQATLLHCGRARDDYVLLRAYDEARAAQRGTADSDYNPLWVLKVDKHLEGKMI